jgi:STE24 endopeptidase
VIAAVRSVPGNRVTAPLRLSLVIRILAVLLIAVGLCAQAQVQLQVPAGAQAGSGFTAESATRAYLDTIPPEKKARSDAYFEGGYWLILWDLVYTAAIALLLLNTGLSARLRDIAERVTSRPMLQTWLYWIVFSLLTFALAFPFSVYVSFIREHQYNLSNQTFGAWFGDSLKGLAISCVFGGLAIAALVGVVRARPRTWHIWGAVVTTALLAFAMLIGPVFIAPMFNTYTVLTDERVREPILSLARANGIPVQNVYQVDASRQSRRISANVSGFLGTERITLNDNLLNRCSPEAIMSVMGHEMGHYVLNHVYKMLLFFVVIAVIFFAGLRLALEWSVARWGERWRVRAVTDIAALPLAILILSVFSFVFTPVSNTLIRTQEYEADIYGLNAARQPDGFAEAALLLGEYRKLEPGASEERIFFDHPSGYTRIYSAMRWKAENPGR